jgi:hypothetical protein
MLPSRSDCLEIVQQGAALLWGRWFVPRTVAQMPDGADQIVQQAVG